MPSDNDRKLEFLEAEFYQIENRHNVTRFPSKVLVGHWGVARQGQFKAGYYIDEDGIRRALEPGDWRPREDKDENGPS